MSDYSELNKEIYSDLIEILLACEEHLEGSSEKPCCWHWGRVEMSLIANHVERKITTERKKVERLVWALSDVTELYCKLINSGDAGFWNPEDDEAIKKAIELLSEIKGEE